MKGKTLIFVFFAVFSVTGCGSYIPFTETRFNQAGNRLDKIQFYISQKIVLRSVAPENKEEIRKIREIVIPRLTEGILHRTERGAMHIQFEPSDEDMVAGTIPFLKTLKLGKELADPDNYVYQFSDREIEYGGRKYTVIFHTETRRAGENDTQIFVDVTQNREKDHYFLKTFYPLLLIDRKAKTEDFDKERRKVPGIKIEDGKNETTRNNRRRANRDFEIFDEIITRGFFISAAKNDVPLKFMIDDFDGTRKIYSMELDFKKTNPHQHYLCSIGVAKAGAYVKDKEFEESYARRKEALLKKHPGKWEEFLEIDFPDIGKRAVWDRGTFGPGGAMFAVMFTSSDGGFDIKASISNLVPNGVDDPEFDIKEMSKKISDMYDKKVGN